MLYEPGGGTLVTAPWIHNYAGVKEISGVELQQDFLKQAKKSGVEIKEEVVEKIEKTKIGFKVYCAEKFYESKSLVIATGVRHKQLGLKDEEKFLGKGVSYCFLCDGAMFSKKEVAVVGGANSAVAAALNLSELTKKVYLIYRGDKLKGEGIEVDKLLKRKKVEIIYNSNIQKLKGNNFLESVVLDSGKEIKVKGLFIEVGFVPVSSLLNNLKVKTEKGFIKVDDEQKTNIKGIFAAGDITSKSKVKQVSVAVGEGAVAGVSAYNYLKK